MAKPVLQSLKSPHFFKPLLPGFHTHLSIPVKFFLKYIQGRNKENMMELTSDANEKTWKVKMEGQKLTAGWKDFAEAHDFRIGDIVVFRHEGDFLFHVTGLGPSFCEIQYVQPSNNHDNDDDEEEEENITKLQRKKHEKKRIHEAESFESDQSCFVAPVTDSNLQKDTLFFPKIFVGPGGLNKESKIVLMDEGGRTWTLNLRFAKSKGTFYMSAGWRRFCLENKLISGDSVTFKQESNNNKKPLLRFSTLEQKCVSTKHSSKEKKRKTVSLTRVQKMENAGGKICLLDKKGVKWLVNIFATYKDKSWRMGLGLKEFLKAIEVKENDPLVFEFVWEDRTSPPILKLLS